jgi:hypothetical protein
MPLKSVWTILLMIASGWWALAACLASSPARTSWEPVPTELKAAIRFLLPISLAGAPRPSPELVTIYYTDRRGSRMISGRDLRPTRELAAPHSPWYETATSGIANVRVVIQRPSGDTLVVGDIPLTLHPDSTWHVDFTIARNPLGIPLGPPFAARKVPLQPGPDVTPADSLHIHVARRSISGPPLPPF